MRRSQHKVRESMTRAILALVAFFAVFLSSCTTTANSEPSPSYQIEDMMCLAQNIYFESRGESRQGQLAVAFVTKNRAESSRFPNSICDVVYQGGIDGSPPRRNRCQFSWYCDGKPDVPRDMNAWQRAKEVAIEVLMNEVDDLTQGATYFHAHYVTPRWSRHFARTIVIDRHIFYADKKQQDIEV